MRDRVLRILRAALERLEPASDPRITLRDAMVAGHRAEGGTPDEGAAVVAQVNAVIEEMRASGVAYIAKDPEPHERAPPAQMATPKTILHQCIARVEREIERA